MKENVKLILSVAVTAFFAAFIFYLNVGAFNGPTQAPPSGSGALTISSSSGLSVGTSTTSANTVLYIVGSTTASGNYGLKVLDSAGTSLFSVQNDGTVNVGATTLSGGSYSGDIVAGNVSAGTFGSNTGGGTFTFSGGLTQSGAVVSLASTTVTGVVTTTNLSVTSVTSALLIAGANGAVSAYGGASACPAGQAVTTISAIGGTACAAFSSVSTSTTNNWTAVQTFKAPIVSTGTVDTVSATTCGTSPSVVGSNGIGRVTTGSNASSTCTVTFGTAFTNKPVCVVTTETVNANTSTLRITPAATTLVIAMNSSTVMKSAVFDYICIGQ